MNRNRKLTVFVASLLLVVSILSTVFTTTLSADTTKYYGQSAFNRIDNNSFYFDRSQYFDTSVVQKLPEEINLTDEISIIIELPGYTVLDYYRGADTDANFSHYYSNSAEAKKAVEEIEKDIDSKIKMLDDAGVNYTMGLEYSTLLRGFEIKILGSEYEKVCKTLGTSASVHISNTYEAADSQVVKNEVSVDGNGIFDGSVVDYDGTGVVVAVLDTGLDYTHSAFSPDRFNTEGMKFKLSDIENIINNNDMAAEKYYAGLTASDLYINAKVPYAFDYADFDPEVFPQKSNHGTHVAGIIAGNNDVITGVAPNAQLAIMKVFSDKIDGARSSWIISALEDCVILGVDVINMSLGASCGFSDPTLEEQVYYDIQELGLSLIVAAGNDNNSAVGSTKNGNLPLTSNPDSATVGSPGSYKPSFTVASISGVPQAYLMYGDKVMYFIEASDRYGEEKNFAEELLNSQDNLQIEFVRVPGIGTNADYSNIDVRGKIALVSRGETTFEQKATIAERNGAAAVIIYNNVSGDIKMNVGEVKIPVASMSQDDGEFLASLGTGVISLSKAQVAGPFMSDFSGWGPGPGLEIKPEITGHGGNITSAVPGEDYDTISGTSMATPNIAGVAALLRDYVKRELPDMVKDEYGNESLKKVTEVVNRLMMSTADIVKNQNGLPYAVRKQGAGLASILKCSTTGAYILTYDREDGSLMDRSKIELGDDPAKTGVYTLKFSIENFTDKNDTPDRNLTYNLSAIVMTEGVSDTKTSHGDTTVTEEAYILSGASLKIKSHTGCTVNGMSITVAPGDTATLEVVITLSDADKKYLNESFANGMYVEGFIVLDSLNEVDLSVPYLSFYGDWTRAPLFDLTYYDTHKDEIDKALDPEDKKMADAYATRPVGGLYSEYLSFLGAYYYVQDPSKTQIAASADKASISNQEGSVNTLRSVWAGLLRNAKTVDIVIKEASTGKIVKQMVEKDGKTEWVDVRTEEEVRKSHGGGGAIRQSSIDIDFSALQHNLKNNTKYIVELKGHLDYEGGGDETNLNNTFTFPLYTDFEAPTLTNCEFYTEYDKTAKKNKLFVRFAIYDNHYSMAAHIGYVGTSKTDINGDGVINNNDAEFVNFDKYPTPIYSTFNAVSYVSYELTDLLSEIKENSQNKNSITIICSDYAMNQSTYEIPLPDDFSDFYFVDIDRKGNETQITEKNLSPNETYNINVRTHPGTQWGELLTYKSSDTSVVKVIGTQLVAIAPGTAEITATGADRIYTQKLTVNVLSKDHDDYVEREPEPAEGFRLSGYYVNYAHYFMSNEDRDIGLTGSTMKFSGNDYSVEIFPSEIITLKWELDSYHKDRTTIRFKSDNEELIKVDQNGKVTAIAEGSTSITVTVLLDGESTSLSETIYFEIKDPYVNLGSQIQNYYGLGGVVDIGLAGLAVKEIGQYAFANYDYIPKTDEELKQISDEDPYTVKIWYLGDNRVANKDVLKDDVFGRQVGKITEIIIPEGIEKIGPYAFAGLTELKKVVFPSTLKSIDVGAFYNCFNLETVEFYDVPGEKTNNVKFFSMKCFQNTKLRTFGNESGVINLESAIAIGDYAFSIEDEILEWNDNPNYGKGKFEVKYDRDTNTPYSDPMNPKRTIVLSEQTQSIGAYVFSGNRNLQKITIAAEKIKLGEYAFKDCTNLSSINLNVAVIPTGAFENCNKLSTFTIGKDVAVIAEKAFNGAGIQTFKVADGNTAFKAMEGGKYVVTNNGKNDTLVLVAYRYNSTTQRFSNSTITNVLRGAFACATDIKYIELPNVKVVGDYAFADCTNLISVQLSKALVSIGNYAFRGANLQSFDFTYYTSLETIGNHAFEDAFTELDGAAYKITINIPRGVKVGDYAFNNCDNITTVIIGNDVILGEGAFNRDSTVFMPTRLQKFDYTDSKGEKWYAWYTGLISPITSVTIGDNVTIGKSAFANATKLTKVTLGSGVIIGDYAFVNAESLNEINLSGVISIGESAFSSYAYNVFVTNEKYIIAMDNTYLNGNFDFDDTKNTQRLVNKEGTQYEVKYIAAPIQEIDLSSLTSLGIGAFAYNNKLTKVTLSSAITEIAYGAFAQCTNLKTINLENVATIGNYAFMSTAIENANLQSATSIGDYAFYDCNNLVSLTLNAEGTAEIKSNAFALCEKLISVANLDKVNVFGDMAFAYTGITNIDLTEATSLGRLVFIKNVATKIELKLGEKLTSISDNPFAYCIISARFAEVEEIFNGNPLAEKVTVYTFDLGEVVKIIDGSIYAKLPNGKLEFITYCGNGGAVKVADNTSRISDYAFAGTNVTSVVLPYELMAIGHKAFFDCKKLSVVTFLGLTAPILEEEYDFAYYATFENIAMSGSVDLFEGEPAVNGLGIVPYYMWSFTDPTNVYYGANFVDYIGHLDDNNIVMVRPVNGKYYDTFIFNQYFDVTVDGATAADETTLAAKELINNLPNVKDLTLKDKAQVEAARAAYNRIMTTSQQALLEDILPLLKAAEQAIANMEYFQQQQNKPSTPDTPDTSVDTNTDTEEDKGLGVGAIIAIILGSIIAAGGIGVGVYFLIRFLSKKKNGVTVIDIKDEDNVSGEEEKDEIPSSEENNQ